MTTANYISFGALFVSALSFILSIVTWRSTKAFQDDQLKKKAWDDYHAALNASFNKDTSPAQYFHRFWEVQNNQIDLWQKRIISDEEFRNYLNNRIEEFKGVRPMPEFEYLKNNPKAESEEYKSYQEAWKTVAAESLSRQNAERNHERGDKTQGCQCPVYYVRRCEASE